jgi:serine protease
MRLLRAAAGVVLCWSGLVWSAAVSAGPRDGADIHALLAADPGLTHDPSSILVGFAPDTSAPARAEAAALVGGKIEYEYTVVPGLCLVRVGIEAGQAVGVLAGRPGVEYVQPNHVVRSTAMPNDPRFAEQWGLHNTGQVINGTAGKVDADVDGPEAWDVYTGNANFAIAIIDTGVLYTHPDLQANIWANPGEQGGNGIDDDGNGYIDDVRGWDWVDDDAAPLGTDGHGTRVAGLVGAVGNNGVGITGVAWRCKLVCLRFLGPDGGLESDAIKALQYCQTEGIKLSNNSWSAGANHSQALYNAINALRQSGHLFVCGAANGGKDLDNAGKDYPSSYTLDNIISVAGTTDKDARWSNSNYGAVTVDLGAPAYKVLSTALSNSYNFGNGTSFAAPHVTGVAALVWGLNPGWTYAQVRSRILSTTRPLPSLAGKTVTGGMVNAAGALQPQTPPAAPTNLTVTNLGGGKARQNWKDNSNNEDKFQVARQKFSGGVWTNLVTVANTAPNVETYTDSPGPGLFRYRVRARNAYGDSAWTPWKQVTVN